MATIKRCDLCREVWDPEETKDKWSDADQNQCTISVAVPADTRTYEHRAKYNQYFEVCQACARAVVKTLEDLAVKPAER